MTSLGKLTTPQADRVARTVLEHCAGRGLLPAPPPGLMDDFHQARAVIRGSFDVPETSLTPLLARVLYGIGAVARPARVLGIGTYAGSLFGYLTAAGFGPDRCYDGTVAVGLDIEPDAVALARRNVAAAGYAPELRFELRDGRTATDLPGGPWDLLFLDADDALVRKAIYRELLDRLSGALAPGALVIAHDVCFPKFGEQLGPYLDTVRGPRFTGSVTLPVDDFGLELSRWHGDRVAA